MGIYELTQVRWKATIQSTAYAPTVDTEDGVRVAALPGMRMWRGVKSAEEIAALAEAAHGRVEVEEAKKEWGRSQEAGVRSQGLMALR